MPSPFGELAEGIFGRLNEHRAEQTKRDDAKRQQTMSVLSGLLDQVEPESQPYLLQQMGEVMGLKGKHRGLWDNLTGRGADGTELALGEKLQQIMGNMVGPTTARKNRSMANFTSAFTPSTPEQQANIDQYKNQADFSKKIVLRDPQQFELDKIKTRYELQNDWNQQKLYETARLRSEEAQRHEDATLASRKTIEEFKAELNDFKTVRKIASEMSLRQENRGKSMDELFDMAADYTDSIRGLQAGTMRQRIATSRAMEQNQLATARNGGITPSQQAGITDRRLDDTRKVFETFSKSRDRARESGERYRGLNTKINDWAKSQGLQWDSTGGTLSGDQMKAIQGRIEFEMANPGIFKNEQDARAEEIKAKQELKASWDLLGTPNFQKYVRRGAHEWEAELIEGAESNAIPTPPAVGTAGQMRGGGLPSGSEGPVSPIGKEQTIINTGNRKVGDVIDAGGKGKWRVTAVGLPDNKMTIALVGSMNDNPPPLKMDMKTGKPGVMTPVAPGQSTTSNAGMAQMKGTPSLPFNKVKVGQKLTLKDGRQVTVVGVSPPQAPNYPNGIIYYQ